VTEQKQKRLLIIFGVVSGILLVAGVWLFISLQKANREDRYLRSRDQGNIRTALMVLDVFKVDQNRYPDQLIDLYPDYTDIINLLKSPRRRDSQLYIYLPPTADASGKIPSDTVLLISPILHSIGQRLVGYADGKTDFIPEKDLPDFKNHSPAN